MFAWVSSDQVLTKPYCFSSPAIHCYVTVATCGYLSDSLPFRAYLTYLPPACPHYVVVLLIVSLCILDESTTEDGGFRLPSSDLEKVRVMEV